MKNRLAIPQPIEQKLNERYNLVEQYPISIPIPKLAEFLGADDEGIRNSIDKGQCPFAIGWQKSLKGNRAYTVPTVPFYLRNRQEYRVWKDERECYIRKITQKEFDSFPVEDGAKQCPSGDYSDIKTFGDNCSFGNDCIFDACCRFGSSCTCEFGEFKKMLSVGGFGSKGRTTYFFLLHDDQVSVRCGCFAGTLEEWEEQVKSEHGDSDLGEAYLALLKPIKLQFQVSLAENEN